MTGAVYREFAVTDDAIACTWTHEPIAATEQLVVPDGCVDLIWLAGRELVVAGPDAGPHRVLLPARSRSVGVRVRPGAAGALLARPAHTVRDARVPAAQLAPEWGARLADRLGSAAASTARTLLLDAVRQREPSIDPVVGRAAALLGRRRRTSEVADELGLSERQLHRRCRDAVGYGPKTLARVVRLRRLVRTDGPLAERALVAGYASQAHMNDDVKRLTGLTPVRFLEDRG